MRKKSGGGVGTLVLVVGASGVGKDTLIDAARAYFARRPGICFPLRVITRADQTGEGHIYMDEPQFAALKAAGGFLLDWRAHGLSYGIPAEVRDELAAGAVVVVNASREAIGDARARWPRVKVVHVTTDPESLRARLSGRGRESAEEIEQRVARAQQITVGEDDDTNIIDNSGPLDESVQMFDALLEFYADEARSG